MTTVIIIIFLQVFVYCVGINVLFNQKIRYLPGGITILGLCSWIYYQLELSYTNMIYVHVSTLLILWILLEGSIKQKFFAIVKSILIIGCSEEIVEAIINIVTSKLYNSIAVEKEIVLANILLLMIYLVIGLIKRKKLKLQRNHLNSLVMIAMGIMSIALVLVISALQYAEPYVNSKRFSVVCDTLTIVAYMGIVILGLFIIYVKNANENYKYLLEMENLLRNSQKNNYEVMLAKEDETRDFRHDISNHIICLQEMIRSENLVDANKYIEQMQIAISQIQKKNYTVGNEILDAILNYYIQQLIEDIEVTISGRCHCNLQINEVELCSIISNPIQNAIEALNNQIAGNRYLNIRMNSTIRNLKIVIINSFSKNHFTMIDGLPGTLKEDKSNHGIGLRNVKKLVEKNNGLFQIDIKENEFQVTVILPVKE